MFHPFLFNEHEEKGNTLSNIEEIIGSINHSEIPSPNKKADDNNSQISSSNKQAVDNKDKRTEATLVSRRVDGNMKIEEMKSEKSFKEKQ